MFRLRSKVLLLALLMAGCGPPAVRNGQDPLAFLAAGAEIQLTRELEVPAGETRVFFQRGRTVTGKELDIYQPGCDLEMRELSQSARKIFKDLFVTGRLTSGREPMVSSGARMLAASVHPARTRMFRDDAPSVHRYLRVELRSSRQPGVMRLTCRGAWDGYYDARPPNEVEIKVALGELMVFR